MAGIERRRPMGATQGQGPWADVLLSDEEALQIIAVLADVLDGRDVRDAVSAAWSLLGNRLAAQAGVATPALRTWPASTGGWLTGLTPGSIGDTLRRCRRTDRLHVCKPNTSGPSRQVASVRPPPVELLLVGAESTLLVPLDGA
jgi:hypothetical protein